MNKTISKLFFASTILFGSVAYAAPYSMVYTGTIDGSTLVDAIDGETYTVEYILDNGGTSALNQTWTSADLQRVVWTMNTAANERISIDYSGTNTLDTEIGDITTDGAGALVTVPANWSDGNGYDPVDILEDTISDAMDSWYVNAANGVFYTTSYSFDDLNVVDNIDPAFWTDPVAEVTPTASDSGAAHPLLLILSGLLLGALRLRATSKR